MKAFAKILCVIALLLALFFPVNDVDQYLTEWHLYFSQKPVTIFQATDMPEVNDVVEGQCRLAHAYCDLWTGTVVLNKKFWEKGNYWQKKKVLYHELGHCVFGLGHPTDPHEYTIMNSWLGTAKTDGSNWAELLEELRLRVGRDNR